MTKLFYATKQIFLLTEFTAVDTNKVSLRKDVDYWHIFLHIFICIFWYIQNCVVEFPYKLLGWFLEFVTETECQYFISVSYTHLDVYKRQM